MERRQFLTTSLMAAAAFTDVAIAEGAFAPGADPSAPAAGGFSEARFRELLGSRFHFTGEEWRGPLQLTDVVARPGDSRTEQFTAVFRSDGRALPDPGYYQVVHPDAGRFALRIDGHRESDVRLATFALLRG